MDRSRLGNQDWENWIKISDQHWIKIVAGVFSLPQHTQRAMDANGKKLFHAPIQNQQIQFHVGTQEVFYRLVAGTIIMHGMTPHLSSAVCKRSAPPGKKHNWLYP
jgi:hypothetical protein